MAIRLVDLALLTPAGHQGAKLALNTLEADFDRMASPCAGLTRASIASEGSATTRARPSSARGSSQAAPAPHEGSRTILVRPSRCLTRCPRNTPRRRTSSSRSFVAARRRRSVANTARVSAGGGSGTVLSVSWP
jgi:hypothetical protein